MVLALPGGIFRQTDVRETPLSEGTINVGDFCTVYRSSNQTISGGTATDINFNAEEYDDSGMHSTSVDTERITVTTPGLYLIHFEVSAMTTNLNQVRFSLFEGATEIGRKEVYWVTSGASGKNPAVLTTIRKVTAATFYHVKVDNVTDTGNVTVYGTAAKDTKLTVMKIQ